MQTNRALRRYVPDTDFVGRDETLLLLDRAFDEHAVVLLHAYAGQGKSATAVEFARWYARTGGLGPHPVVMLSVSPLELGISSCSGARSMPSNGSVGGIGDEAPSTYPDR